MKSHSFDQTRQSVLIVFVVTQRCHGWAAQAPLGLAHLHSSANRL